MKKRFYIRCLLSMNMMLLLFCCCFTNAMAQSNIITMDQSTESIYELFKIECRKIAQGEKSSIINLNTSVFFQKDSYSYEELGIDTTDKDVLTLNTKAKEIIRKEMKTKIHAVLDRMKIDCPYELYWLDRETDITMNFSYTKDSKGVYFEDSDFVSITMYVARDYQYQGVPYKIDPQVIKRAQTSMATAKSIVAKYASYSDNEKIYAYAKEIKALTFYNQEALTQAYHSIYGYGDPYQLLSVFDQNPSTGTVCEGYAKAFQYLCNLSHFNNSICYAVTGSLRSSNTTGTHMWNIIRQNNNNYIVDITNTDETTCDLVLVGAVKLDQEYMTTNHSKQKLYYTYDQETLDLYRPLLLEIKHRHMEADPVKENLVEATCSTPTSYDTVIYCRYCQEELSRKSYTGTTGEHSYINTTVARSCCSDGYTLHVCSKCGYSYKNSVIPSYGGHTWNDGSTNADTTITYQCKRCKETKTVGTPKTTAASSSKLSTTATTSQKAATTASKATPKVVTPVKNKALKITLSGSSSVKVGKSLALKATVKTKTGAAIGVRWSVNNKKYAKIDSKGKLTTLKAGKGKKVTVTATAADGSGVKASKTITIKK